MKKILQKVLMTAAIAYIASAPWIYVLYNPSKELITITLLSGTLLAVLSRFADVTELGLLGLKAKIERTLDQTHATLEQVRALAKISSISSLSNTARSGWLGGITDEQSEEILNSTQEALRKLGISSEEIRKVALDYHDCRLTEFRQTLLGGGTSQVPNLRADVQKKVDEVKCLHEWKDLRNRPVTPPVSPTELYEFFEKYGFLNADNKKRLNAYKHYYERHEFLDFQDFKSRDKWPIMSLTG